MIGVDPRERVIQIGNELLDALYEWTRVRTQAEALSAQLERGEPMQPGAIRDTVIPLLHAEQRYNTLAEKYLTTRELVEAFDAAGASR